MINIQFNIKSRRPLIERAIKGLPFALSRGLNDALFSTRDKLIQETWPKELERAARGRKLKIARRKAAGRATFQVKKSDEHNPRGTIFADLERQGLTSMPAPGSARSRWRANLTAEEWIHGFVHSTSPVFWGKSKKDRIRMALGAYYRVKRSLAFRETAGKIDTSVWQREFHRLMTEAGQRRMQGSVRRAIR